MKIPVISLVAAILLSTATANAALIGSVNGQTVYDTDLNVSWQTNANLAATNNFGISETIQANGKMSWDTAQRWIAAMNAANYLGYHDWRLPTSDICGFNCTGSEMGHLFYNELGGVWNQSISTTHNNANYALFHNIQSEAPYWSGTEDLSDTYCAMFGGCAWNFYFGGGGQGTNIKGTNFYVLAVRPGQVTAVPVLSAAWLLGSGLLGLIGVARRKAA